MPNLPGVLISSFGCLKVFCVYSWVTFGHNDGVSFVGLAWPGLTAEWYCFQTPATSLRRGLIDC